MRVFVGIMAMVLLFGALLQSWRLDKAQQTVTDLRSDIAALNQAVEEKKQQIITLNETAKENDRYQATLQQQIEALTAGVAAKNHRIKELINENAELKRWADTPLPAGIIRLQQRPAITGAAGYHAYLSQHHPLSATSGSADNKR